MPVLYLHKMKESIVFGVKYQGMSMRQAALLVCNFSARL